MDTSSKRKTARGKKVAKESQRPRSAEYAARGIKTANDFASLMSALMSDLIEGRVPPGVGNATCNAGGKLLKITEMQYKYGVQGSGTGRRTLELTVEEQKAPELKAVNG